MLRKIARSEHRNKDNKPTTYSKRQAPFSLDELERDLLTRGEEDEVVELSPLAQLVSSFTAVDFDSEQVDDNFYFTLDATGSYYNIRLLGRLSLNNLAWNMSWNFQVLRGYNRAKNDLVAIFENFLQDLKPYLEEEGDNTGKVIINDEWGKELWERYGIPLRDKIKDFLNLVILLGGLPEPEDNKNLSYLSFRENSSGQLPDNKRAYYFKWALLEEMIIDYREI